MRFTLALALAFAGCARTPPAASPPPAPVDLPAPPVTPAVPAGATLTDAARREAEQNEYYVIRDGEYHGAGRVTYQLSVNTPTLPQALLDDLAVRYGTPDQRVRMVGDTWRGVSFPGIEGPVDLTVGVNGVDGLETAWYVTFVSARASGGADLLRAGSPGRAAVEAYLRELVTPPGDTE